MKLIAIRHAEVVDTGICYGRLDVPTQASPNERKALLHELKRLIGATPCVIWSSPSERCSADAHALGTLINVIPRLDARLYEIAFGKWEGELWSDLETQGEFKEWMLNWQTATPPDGECLRDLSQRVSDWLAQLPYLAQLPSDTTHVVFTHAGVIRQLHVSLTSLDWQDAMRLPVPYLTPILWNRPF
jgi:alpha-ribazole phosphatase